MLILSEFHHKHILSFVIVRKIISIWNPGFSKLFSFEATIKNLAAGAVRSN
jgi:hypothetical protein